MMSHAREARLVPRRRRAFSLIELLLVLAITATLSLIAMPRYATARDAYLVDAAVNRVMADLGVARAIARAEDRSVKVKFDPGRDSYEFDGEPDPYHPGVNYAVDLRLTPYDADLFAVDFDGGKEVAFDRYGAAVRHDGNAFEEPGTITLKCGAATRSIIVDVATGRARLP